MDKINCRCCGKRVMHSDNEPIHTRCIRKHWIFHKYKLNNSRCVEFKQATVKNYYASNR